MAARSRPPAAKPETAITIDFADYVERKLAAGGITVPLPDGTKIVIPPAELWVDEVYAALAVADVAKACDLVLGVEQSKAFAKAGGNWRILSGIIAEAEGVPVGESGASSS